MKRGKWIVATAALALGLCTGAFAGNQPWNDFRDRDAAVYTHRDSGRRVQAWNNGYRDNDDKYRRDNDGRYRKNDDRDQHMRDRDHRDRDHDRRDRDDRDRGRD